MNVKILTLLFILSYSGVVFSSCSGGLGFDCFYDILFGEDESSEEDLNEEITKNLTSAIHNTGEKLQELPKIVGYLKNLTLTVVHVKKELIGTPSVNEIEKKEVDDDDEEEEDSEESQNLKEQSSNLSPKRSGKKSENDEEKKFVSDISKLSQMIQSLIEQVESNKPKPNSSEKEKLEELKKDEASKNSESQVENSDVMKSEKESEEKKEEE